MKIRKLFILLSLCLMMIACSNERKPIKYGEDQCDYCSMAIVKKTHAAQLVTNKGKQYKYDAIECMINHKHENPSKFKNALFFIANYSNPGEMVNAKKATYLISKELPSPMGANLTGFKDSVQAKKIQEKKSGKLYNWLELLNDVNFSQPNK